jgi:hypothetical protein
MTNNDKYSGTFTGPDAIATAFRTARCQRGQRINSTIACTINTADQPIELNVFDVSSTRITGFTASHKLTTVSFNDIDSLVIR